MIPKADMLKLLHINARSICNKIPSLHHSIYENNIDICAVSETWIKQDDDHPQRELAPPGYKVLSYPQSDGCVGAGLAFILKDYLKVIDPTQNTTFSTMETHLITLKLQSINLSIRLVYRLLQVSVLNFCNEFLDMIERDFNVTKDKSIIIGDFNIHMDTPTESDVIIVNDLLESLNIENRITFLTHKSQHTLDLIIEDRNEKSLYNLEKGHLFSDQNFIHSTLDVRKEAPPKKTLTYRSLKGIDIKDLAKDIIGALDDFEGDVKQLVDNYNNNIRKCLDPHALIKTKVVKTIHRHPWFNDKIRAEVKLRRQKERRWNKDPNEYNYMAFYYQRRHVANIIQTTQRNY